MRRPRQQDQICLSGRVTSLFVLTEPEQHYYTPSVRICKGGRYGFRSWIRFSLGGHLASVRLDWQSAPAGRPADLGCRLVPLFESDGWRQGSNHGANKRGQTEHRNGTLSSFPVVTAQSPDCGACKRSSARVARRDMRILSNIECDSRSNSASRCRSPGSSRTRYTVGFLWRLRDDDDAIGIGPHGGFQALLQLGKRQRQGDERL
jgi:hypothetical protein